MDASGAEEQLQALWDTTTVTSALKTPPSSSTQASARLLHPAHGSLGELRSPWNRGATWGTCTTVPGCSNPFIPGRIWPQVQQEHWVLATVLHVWVSFGSQLPFFFPFTYLEKSQIAPPAR